MSRNRSCWCQYSIATWMFMSSPFRITWNSLSIEVIWLPQREYSCSFLGCCWCLNNHVLELTFYSSLLTISSELQLLPNLHKSKMERDRKKKMSYILKDYVNIVKNPFHLSFLQFKCFFLLYSKKKNSKSLKSGQTCSSG